MVEKREQILEATADLIAECGLQASPMSKVAKSACCGAGTIYRYFETKDELVQELYLQIVQKMTTECLKNYNEADCIKIRFYTFWGNFYCYMRSNPRDCALVEQLSSSPAICGDFKDRATQTIHNVLDQLMNDGKQQHLFKELPNDVLTMFTYGSVLTIAKTQSTMPEKLDGKLNTDDLLNLCWDAIKA
ncbi:TetR/AcrR family transcriptional regulator [Bacterioplanoides sp.]|uniref:TetR/AcrR family transcriptional regulator n=1 Tax=Bacterioplanoides sp. TaxID=2066072 RepID=UPI003B00548A